MSTELLKPNFENIPACVRDSSCWALWKALKQLNPDGSAKYDDFGNIKYDKPPYDPNRPGFAGSPINPSKWATFERAMAAYQLAGQKANGSGHPFAGVSIVLTDRYWKPGELVLTVIDVDYCRDPETGGLDDRGQAILDTASQVGGCYVEISPSQTGLRLLCYSSIRELPANKANGAEVYNNGRHATITGHQLPESEDISPEHDCTTVVEKVLEVMGVGKDCTRVQRRGSDAGWGEIAIELGTQPSEDFEDKLGELMQREKFRTLWERDRPDMPDQSASGFCMGLANHAVTIDITDQEIVWLLEQWLDEQGEASWDNRPDKFQRTIARARSWIREEKDPEGDFAPLEGAETRIGKMQEVEKDVVDEEIQDKIARARAALVKVIGAGPLAQAEVVDRLAKELGMTKADLKAELRALKPKKAPKSGARKIEEEAILESKEGLPVIKLFPGRLTASVNEVAKALAESSEVEIYQRGDTLASVVRQVTKDEREGINVPTGTTILEVPSEHGILYHMGRVAKFQKFNSAGMVVTADPTPMIAKALLDSRSAWGEFKPLFNVVSVPIIDAKGNIWTTPGYDTASQLFYDGSAPELTVSTTVDVHEARAAATTLLELFREFPFVGDVRLARAVCLSYLLTLLLRSQMPIAPVHDVNATTPGTGKGLLVQVANLAVFGLDAATMVPPSGLNPEEENRKRITALLLQGAQSILLDNWDKPVGGASLNTLLTADTWSDRVLGSSTVKTFPNRVTIAATGNNLVVRGDMTRRSVMVVMDPECERPELRNFEVKDLVGWTMKNRPRLLSAAYSLVKGFRQAGCPGADENLLGRFETWSSMVAAPIRWVGLPDPIESQKKIREGDPDLEHLHSVLMAMVGRFGLDNPVTVNEVVLAVEELGNKSFEGYVLNDDGKVVEVHDYPQKRVIKETLRGALMEVASERGVISNHRLGWYFRRYDGRVVGGLRLVRGPQSDKKTVMVTRA